MDDEIKVRVQWSRGAILPVLAKASSKASELSRLLRFACSPNDEVILLHNGVPLNPELTLASQLVNDNDILEAYITRKSSNNTDELDSKIHSIVFEAARVSDRHFDALEKEPYRIESSKKSSSDDEYMDLFDYDRKEDTNEKESITSEPLPTFWARPNSENPSLLSSYLPPKVTSIEEAGQFLEKQGWSSWMW